MSTDETCQRILDAAEILFAEQGVKQSTTRQITEAAGVNVAAVNYHFGNKDKLLEAIFERRIGPLNATRLELLDAELAAASGENRRPYSATLVKALFCPVLDAFSSGTDSVRFHLLTSHILNDPTSTYWELFFRFMGPFILRFQAAFVAALPHIPPDEIIDRIEFSIGALCHAHKMMSGQNPPRRSDSTRNPEDENSRGEIAGHLLHFITHAMEAPCSSDS